MNLYRRLSQSQLKVYCKLTQKKYRRLERKFLVEGMKLVEEAINSDWHVEEILVSPDHSAKSVEAQARAKGLPIMELTGVQLSKLSDTVTSQGVVAIVTTMPHSLEELWRKLPKQSRIVALEGVSDPGNVGTIIRTSDWFGVDAVLLDVSTAELYNPKVVRSTMGSIFHLPIIPDIDLAQVIRDAKKQQFRVIATVVNGGKLPGKFTFPEKSLLIFGSEAHGISPSIQQYADECLTIPKSGRAESLNVAIACGIILNSLRINR
jgi:TrmH family RNA methyltransferase